MMFLESQNAPFCDEEKEGVKSNKTARLILVFFDVKATQYPKITKEDYHGIQNEYGAGIMEKHGEGVCTGRVGADREKD